MHVWLELGLKEVKNLLKLALRFILVVFEPLGWIVGPVNVSFEETIS